MGKNMKLICEGSCPHTVGDSHERDCAFPDCVDTSDCKTCKISGMKPSHNGSTLCESGSIASGGTKSHCTCDTCF